MHLAKAVHFSILLNREKIHAGGNVWMIWPENPACSVVLFSCRAFLYARAGHAACSGRSRVPSAIRCAGRPRLASSACCCASASPCCARARFGEPMIIEREFERVTRWCSATCRAIRHWQRQAHGEITRIEEDYRSRGYRRRRRNGQGSGRDRQDQTSGDGLDGAVLADISQSIDEIYDKVVGRIRPLLPGTAQDPSRASSRSGARCSRL